MKIAVLAANGRSGKAFVARALADGHSVRAGIYRHSSLTPHERLQIIPCDATSKHEVTNLLEGVDAVVSFIGHVRGSDPHVQRDAMKVLVKAMNVARLHRVVSLTGTGVRFDGDAVGPVDRVLNASIAFIDPDRINDGIEHVGVLKSSGLDWTVIRVLKLQNFRTKPFVLTEHGPTRWFVNRDEVAAAVLQVLVESKFVRAAPILSKR